MEALEKSRGLPIYRIGSLFSGAGGLDLGFLMTQGFTVIFANEILEHMTRTYSKNFGLPLVENGQKADLPCIFRGSAEELDLQMLKDINVEVLLAGPPCQEFSIVRGPEWDRRGIEVQRGRLYQHFLRVAAVLKPALLVFENVPGLMSANRGAAVRAVVSDFEAGWSCVFAGVLDSAAFGVPQRRRRLIMIGLRRDLLRQINAEQARRLFQTQLQGAPLLAKYPLTPLEAFEGKVLIELKDKYRQVMEEYEDILGRRPRHIVDDYLKANRIKESGSSELEAALNLHAEVMQRLGWLGRPVAELSLPDGSTELPKESAAVLDRMKRIPPDKNCEAVKGTDWEVEGRGISLIYRRLHPLKPAYTVVAYGGGGTWGYHYERNRSKMTQRERARLQSFPDWFEFCGSAQEIRAQIGEAVPPLLAKRIAEACAEALEML
ncbi:DNA cytosine methyltransferase [Dehalococcoidales bacterium]|nr:DNA cytosine methyltransferase [Dehalococcoidales bacterium]